MGIRRLRLPPSHPGPAACEIRPPEPGHRGVHRDRIDARSQLVRSMRVLRRRPRMDAGPGRTPRHGVEVGTRPARARPHVPADRSRRVPGRCRPKRRQEPGGLPSRQMRQGMRHPSGHPGPHHQRAGNRHRRTGSPLQRLPPVSRASSERHRCSPAIQKLCFGASRTARPPGHRDHRPTPLTPRPTGLQRTPLPCNPRHSGRGISQDFSHRHYQEQGAKWRKCLYCTGCEHGARRGEMAAFQAGHAGSIPVTRSHFRHSSRG
jgi:hypothetical protein